MLCFYIQSKRINTTVGTFLLLSDTDGRVRKSSHLLNITLTMHRLLMPSGDLLDKLISLYPSAVHYEVLSQHSLVIQTMPISSRTQNKGSDRRPCCFRLVVNGNGQSSWLSVHLSAVSVRCDRRTAVCVYSYVHPP